VTSLGRLSLGPRDDPSFWGLARMGCGQGCCCKAARSQSSRHAAPGILAHRRGTKVRPFWSGTIVSLGEAWGNRWTLYYHMYSGRTGLWTFVGWNTLPWVGHRRASDLTRPRRCAPCCSMGLRLRYTRVSVAQGRLVPYAQQMEKECRGFPLSHGMNPACRIMGYVVRRAAALLQLEPVPFSLVTFA